MPSTRVTFLLAALLVATAVAPAAASPRPTHVCSACGEGFARAVEYQETDVEVTVERSTAVVRVGPDGTAEWTVRNRLSGPDADRLRTNATLLREVGDDAFLDRRTTLTGVESTDRGVVLRYRSPDGTRRYGAALVGLGVVAALHPAYAGPAPLLGGYDPLLLAGGVATLVAGGAGLVAERVPPERRLPLAVLAALAGAVLGVGAAALAVVPGASLRRSESPTTTLLWAAPLVPFLLALPAGYLAAGDRRGWHAALAAVALAFVPVADRFGPLTSEGGPFALLGAVLLVGGAVGLAACGAPLFVLGASLRGRGESA